MTEKDPGAFRTISEVAAELDLPAHVLRFWETKFGQIRPMKRSGGRRLYRPEDIVLVRLIRDMLYGQGYTIRGVQRILKERGVRTLLADGAAPAPLPQDLAGFAPGEGTAEGQETGLESPDRLSRLRVIEAELRACAELLHAMRGSKGEAVP